MSIKLGIYEFFSYTIPGGFYLFGIVFVIERLTTLRIDLINMTIPNFIIFSVAAYVTGLIFDSLSDNLWSKRFESKNLIPNVIADLNERNQDFEITTKKISWYILLSHIKNNNGNIAGEVEQHNATRIMLRNISFAFLLYTFLPIIDFIEFGFNIWQIVVTIGCLGISIIALKEAIKYRRWFYTDIYQNIAALEITSRDLPLMFKNQESSSDLQPDTVSESVDEKSPSDK